MQLISFVLPFLTSISFLTILFAKKLSFHLKYITTGLTFVSFFFSIILCYFNLIDNNIIFVDLMPWIFVDTLLLKWSFCYDSLTVIMLLVVTSISSLVHLYSIEYMKTDPHLNRFMSYLSLFTFFMLILITANNFLQMFVGWEGVGLASYLLINFWYTRIQANKSAIKAMLVNRIGDFCLLIAIFTIFYFFNSLDYDIIFSLASYTKNYILQFGCYQINCIDFICLLLFGGAMGKSAQIGLHTWLPDAMEGPTPVSALIHAATMVTAGVFLIIRCSSLFENSPVALAVITFVGAITAFFASTTGLFQNDMKKVIAYSTCSQLGYMVFSCGLSNYNVGLFHLANHAFFKALLFLGAGSVIHALSDEQDMRKMGGLRQILPLSYAVMLIGSLALMGFPYLAGFYSKDIILEVSYMSYTWIGQCSYVLGTLAALTTAFYSFKLLTLVFLSETNGNKNVIFNAHEGSIFMIVPLVLLCILSIFVGFVTKELMIGFGTDFWGSAIYINIYNNYIVDIEFFENYLIKQIPLIVSLCSSTGSYLFYLTPSSRIFPNSFYAAKNFRLFYTFFNKKWYFDRIYNQFITQNLLIAGFKYFYVMIDRGILEKIGPFGISNRLKSLLTNFSIIHTGFILDYIIYSLFFLILFIIFMINKNILLIIFGLYILYFYDFS